MNLGDHRQVAQAEGNIPVIYFAFDLLHLDGFDLRPASLEDRRVFLGQVIVASTSVAKVDPIEADAATAYEAVVSLGFEGLVAKRRGGQYRAGRRSESWLKLKHRLSDEFVVGGFTLGEGRRDSTFGGLLLGTPRDDGLLDFCGRVGSGFADVYLASLRKQLDSIAINESPFAGEVPDGGKTVFVRPELVAEVEYAEVTSGGILRAPVFHGMRTDKSPADLRVAAEPLVALPKDGLAQDVASVLDQLEAKKQKLDLHAGEHSLGVTNLDKELWPAFGSRPPRTKRDYLRYLATVAPVLLPHLRDRPLTLTRYPDGITGNSFYQRHWQEKDMPAFVDYITMFTDTNGGDRPFLLCNNLPTLLWLGQLADIELHASLARVNPEPDATDLPTDFAHDKETVEASVLNYPDHLLFDLDPYIYAGTEKKGDEPQFNRGAFDATCEVAGFVREVLAGLRLSAFLKTSGATGLHLYVPIVRNLGYGEVRALALTIAQEVLSRAPKLATLEWATDRRTGKVFIDVNQNARIKSLACQYSPRAKPGAPVSTPLRWDELGKRYPDEFTLDTAPARVNEVGDLWGAILQSKVDLAETLGI
jgi:bifunctional non-homologous end joining protein LigD